MVFQSILHLIWRFLFEWILCPWHTYCPWKIPQTTHSDGTFHKCRKRASFGPLSWVCNGLFQYVWCKFSLKGLTWQLMLWEEMVPAMVFGILWKLLRSHLENEITTWSVRLLACVSCVDLSHLEEVSCGSFYFLLEDLWTDNAGFKNPQRTITVVVLITSQRSTSGVMAVLEFAWHQADTHFCKLLKRNPGLHGPLNCT